MLDHVACCTIIEPVTKFSDAVKLWKVSQEIVTLTSQRKPETCAMHFLSSHINLIPRFINAQWLHLPTVIPRNYVAKPSDCPNAAALLEISRAHISSQMLPAKSAVALTILWRPLQKGEKTPAHLPSIRWGSPIYSCFLMLLAKVNLKKRIQKCNTARITRTTDDSQFTSGAHPHTYFQVLCQLKNETEQKFKSFYHVDVCVF